MQRVDLDCAGFNLALQNVTVNDFLVWVLENGVWCMEVISMRRGDIILVLSVKRKLWDAVCSKIVEDWLPKKIKLWR